MYTELRSAVARAERENRIELPQKVTIIEAMKKDWLTLNIVQPIETLIRRAGLLCDQFGLRGFGSIHLAAAEAINLQTSHKRHCLLALIANSINLLLH